MVVQENSPQCGISSPFHQSELSFLSPDTEVNYKCLFSAKASVDYICCVFLLDYSSGILFHHFILMPKSYQVSLSFRDRSRLFPLSFQIFLKWAPVYLSFCSISVLYLHLSHFLSLFLLYSLILGYLPNPSKTTCCHGEGI